MRKIGRIAGETTVAWAAGLLKLADMASVCVADHASAASRFHLLPIEGEAGGAAEWHWQSGISVDHVEDSTRRQARIGAHVVNGKRAGAERVLVRSHGLRVPSCGLILKTRVAPCGGAAKTAI